MIEQSKKEEKAWSLSMFLLSTGLIIATWMLQGVCIGTMWNWFIVPMGAPTMPYAVAMGVTVIFVTLKIEADGVKSKKRTAEEDGFNDGPLYVIARSLGSALACLLNLGFAKILHLAAF